MGETISFQHVFNSNVIAFLALNFTISSIDNRLIYMHSIPHNSHFINHLLLIVGFNGAEYEACVRELTIKLIAIYKSLLDER